ncbi:hypothetical protein V2J09_014511 [Rumex salicifolius]
MASAVTIPCFNGFSPSISELQSRRLHCFSFNAGSGSSKFSSSSKRTMTVRAQSINPEVRKNEEKVVDSVVVSELAKPTTAYCRCWRSGTFPLCDGGHMKHNKATGDNVGPLLLKKQ